GVNMQIYNACNIVLCCFLAERGLGWIDAVVEVVSRDIVVGNELSRFFSIFECARQHSAVGFDRSEYPRTFGAEALQKFYCGSALRAFFAFSHNSSATFVGSIGDAIGFANGVLAHVISPGCKAKLLRSGRSAQPMPTFSN